MFSSKQQTANVWQRFRFIDVIPSHCSFTKNTTQKYFDVHYFKTLKFNQTNQFEFKSNGKCINMHYVSTQNVLHHDICNDDFDWGTQKPDTLGGKCHDLFFCTVSIIPLRKMYFIL